LFLRMNAHFSEDIVHEKIILPRDSVIGALKHPILHHSYKDLTHVLYKMNKYSSYSAKTRLASKKKISLTRTVLGSLWMFLRCYVLQRGFLDGKAGFLLALFQAEGSFYRGLKQIYKDVDIEGLPSLSGTQKEELF
jgi:hypothetical protein